jgi:hypothetical protein
LPARWLGISPAASICSAFSSSFFRRARSSCARYNDNTYQKGHAQELLARCREMFRSWTCVREPSQS